MQEPEKFGIYFGNVTQVEPWWLTALNELRRRRPKAEVVLFTGPALDPPEELRSVVDSIETLHVSRRSRQGLRKALRLPRSLQARGFDRFIIVHDAASHRLIAALSGCRSTELWWADSRIYPIAGTVPRFVIELLQRWPRNHLRFLRVWLHARFVSVRPVRVEAGEEKQDEA